MILTVQEVPRDSISKLEQHNDHSTTGPAEVHKDHLLALKGLFL